MSDKELIEAAIAAGKLRSIPKGITLGHPSWPQFASPDPLQTVMGKRLYLVLKANPGTAYTAQSILKELSARGIAATSPSMQDRYDRVRGAFALLAAHGIVEELPPVRGGGRRWKLRDGSRPAPILKEHRAESRRLSGKDKLEQGA